MNYSLSTSWNFRYHTNGHDLIREIISAGFDSVELSFALTEAIVNDILGLKNKGEIKVSSLHNMCPLPEEIDPAGASPDHYSLSSPDDEQRRMAVRIAMKTMDYAKRFGAKAVVLHAGRIEIRDRMRQLAELSGDKSAFRILRAEMIDERLSSKSGYLDNLLKSLDEIVSYSAATGVCVGIENRYHYREMPLADELEVIFNTFPAGRLYYWHDVGHAEVFERLGLCRHSDLLERFAPRLIGVHLHDIIGVMDDHKPPGTGTFDFKVIKPYLSGDTLKVLEVHHPAEAGEICRSAEYLDRVFNMR